MTRKTTKANRTTEKRGKRRLAPGRRRFSAAVVSKALTLNQEHDNECTCQNLTEFYRKTEPDAWVDNIISRPKCFVTTTSRSLIRLRVPSSFRVAPERFVTHNSEDYFQDPADSFNHFEYGFCRDFNLERLAKIYEEIRTLENADR